VIKRKGVGKEKVGRTLATPGSLYEIPGKAGKKHDKQDPSSKESRTGEGRRIMRAEKGPEENGERVKKRNANQKRGKRLLQRSQKREGKNYSPREKRPSSWSGGKGSRTTAQDSSGTKEGPRTEKKKGKSMWRRGGGKKEKKKPWQNRRKKTGKGG